MSSTVNEGSAAYVTIVPRNRTGAVFTPGTLRYRLDDLASGASIIDWTSATPSTSVEITIPASANAIINSALSEETKVFTFEFDAGTSTAYTDETCYDVENLSFIS